ncbi:hypothetical protein AWB74_03398 [Caballeronia arvi]|uniref:Uncharacterized protein n=1 Tax=Caballeronia arvi TaxID=1777135 RepID=A0A158J637_9BURK|nr:hypothetical protein [Caballeronia arvi]SAL63903.1 hypothetical protein AWB74_03398 [Caballeronia arvi]
MPSLLDFALTNPGLILLPAIAGVLVVVLLRVKDNYLSRGVFSVKRMKKIGADNGMSESGTMQQHVYRLGDKCKAYCPQCDELVSTTFEQRDLDEPTIKAKDALVAVCDQCGSVVALTGSSGPSLEIGRL